MKIIKLHTVKKCCLALCFLAVLTTESIAEVIPSTAEECLTNFIENVEKVRERYAVYGQAEILETSKDSPGPVRLEWFIDEVRGDSPPPRRYAESKWRYETNDPFSKDSIERTLFIGDEVYFASGRRSRSLRLLKIPGDKKEVRERRTAFLQNRKYPVPNLFALSLFHNSIIKMPHGDDETAKVFFQSMNQVKSEKFDEGIRGTWISKPKHGTPRMLQIEFEESNGFMPSFVRGKFLVSMPKVGEDFDISTLKSTLWYENRTEWRPIEAGTKAFVPIELTNTLFRLNKSTKVGREVQVAAFWSRPDAEAIELDPQAINAEFYEPGALARVRKSLVSKFHKR